MTIGTISSYQDFCTQLRLAGFSLGGENSEGIFSLASFFDKNIHWHTGDADTDPWAFRMRVLKEENDIGYGKVFLQKGGFMTVEWAPYFWAVKRQHHSYEEIYQSGRMRYMEHLICRFVEQKGDAALHEIKAAVGEKGLEAALARLQTGMILTISGECQKRSKDNIPYGWPVTTFRMTEDFWGSSVATKAASLSPDTARAKITARVLELNPAANAKAIDRFLR